MKLRKQFIKKIITAIIFFIIAIFATILLKDFLMSLNPEYALPVVYVRCNGEILPEENQMLESYSWRFSMVTKSQVLKNSEDVKNLTAAWEPPNAPLRISFSFDSKELKISRADDDSTSFVEVGGELLAPSKPGTYTYKVEGKWGEDKWLVYYFKIRIPEQR